MSNPSKTSLVTDGPRDIGPAVAERLEAAETIVAVVDSPVGKRAFRVHVDPSRDGCEAVNLVADRIAAEFLPRFGPGDPWSPRRNTPELQRSVPHAA